MTSGADHSNLTGDLTGYLTGDLKQWQQQWQLWHSDRETSVAGPTGQTALTGTHWISATTDSGAEVVDGLPGLWHTTVDGVTGTGLPTGYGASEVELTAGQSISDGTVTLTVIERGGRRAVRTFDRAARTRTAFTGIDTFAPSGRWVLPATFIPDSRTVGVTAIDGYVSESTAAGWVRFTVDGAEHRLQVSADGDGSLRAVFSDASTALGTHRFRFLSVDRPDPAGHTVIDFNYAYLPPCAFSDHFLCPLPAAENRLDISVEAGERAVVLAETDPDGHR